VRSKPHSNTENKVRLQEGYGGEDQHEESPIREAGASEVEVNEGQNRVGLPIREAHGGNRSRIGA
jgi:hypothetical protein